MSTPKPPAPKPDTVSHIYVPRTPSGQFAPKGKP